MARTGTERLHWRSQYHPNRDRLGRLSHALFAGLRSEAQGVVMRGWTGFVVALVVMAAAPAGAEPPPVGQPVAIFAAEKKHNHASCVVELPGGDVMVAWYRGTGERTADDVEVWAARLAKGQGAWGERFLLADVPGYPDCNPALFAAPDKSLWLWRPVILDHRWEGALLLFSTTRQYPEPGKPVVWDREGVQFVTPVGFEAAADEALKSLAGMALRIDATEFEQVQARSKDLLYQRMGWMPRVHPTVLASGRWLLPLYTDTFSCSIVLRSDDQGKTWAPSNAMIGFGNIQPSLVAKKDGTVVAYMRDNGPFRKIRMSTSSDQGATWGPVTSTELPNPGAGIEAIRLASGRWGMIYNDTTRGRYSLAMALSEDEGKTWPTVRHVALDPEKKRSFHYPSITQGADGTIHVTYTHGGQPEGSTIDYVRLDEEWIRQGDPK